MNWSPLQNTSQCLDKPVLGVEHYFFTFLDKSPQLG